MAEVQTNVRSRMQPATEMRTVYISAQIEVVRAQMEWPLAAKFED